MPRLPRQYVESDSRSASVGIKRSAVDFQDSLLPVAKCTQRDRKTVGEACHQDLVQTGDSLSSAETILQPPTDSFLLNSRTYSMGSVLDSSLGVNRLRSGFVSEKRMDRNNSHSNSPPNNNNSPRELPMRDAVYDMTTEDDDGGMTLNVNGEALDPIIISDDENDPGERFSDIQSGNNTPHTNRMTELAWQAGQKDRGSTNNDQDGSGTKELRKQRTQPSGVETQTMVVDSEGPTRANTNSDGPVFVVDTGPSSSLQVCLKDLSPNQLEHQFLYAFWYLDRHQIDLSRPARCLNCQQDGHTDEMCPQKICVHCGANASHESDLCPEARRCERCRETGHDKSDCRGMKNTTIPCDICSLPGHHETNCPLKYFPRSKESLRPMKLWISCCACASRTHLVGDCPEVLAEKAARWSLRSLNAEQVTNLSIQAGIRNLEQEAENRNMRPAGMKIKGRANIHHADANRRDQSDSDEQDFFGYPSAAQRFGRDTYRSRPDIREGRHDTFRPSAKTDVYRPPRNDFYATNSFGQARSRSPGPFRHRDDRGRRSPSSDRSSRDFSYRHNRGHDSYQGGPSRQTIEPIRARGAVSIQLRNPKGSKAVTQNQPPKTKTNLPAKPPKSAPNPPATKKESSAKARKKKPRKPRRNEN